MDIYLVGGAVRDKLLGLPVTDRDWVVVGVGPRELIDQGFRPVGRDFPVFIHPQTGEEYALARTERKTAPGYKGFAFHTDTSITLEEDLYRRDITINAMAEDNHGRIIDPFDGRRDLRQRVLRHVSPAFAEDPVRILRVARFAARFHDFGFQVADDTLELMKTMVRAGETQHLVPERVWQECHRALSEPYPGQFFAVLDACGALVDICPELNSALLPDCMRNLNRAARVLPRPESRFAALCLAVDERQIRSLCNQLRVPGNFRDLALLVKRSADIIPAYRQQGAETIAGLLRATDASGKTERFMKAVAAVLCLSNLDPALQSAAKMFWEQALYAFEMVDTQELINQGYQKSSLGEAIFQVRIDNIQRLLSTTARQDLLP